MNKFGPNIWTVEGPEVDFFGFPYPTRMVVVRLVEQQEKAGCAWIWSPVAISEELVQEVELKAGPVKYIVSPNMIHHVFLKSWADRFPEAKVFFPPGLQERQHIAKDIRVDGIFGQEGNEKKFPFQDEIDVVVVKGSYFMEEVEFFHKASKTAILCDIIQRHHEHDMKNGGWKGWLMKLDRLVGENGSTPREWRFSFWPFGKTKLHEARDAMLGWKAEKLIIAHGECANQDATAVMERAFSWM